MGSRMAVAMRAGSASLPIAAFASTTSLALVSTGTSRTWHPRASAAHLDTWTSTQMSHQLPHSSSERSRTTSEDAPLDFRSASEKHRQHGLFFLLAQASVQAQFLVCASF